jgi:hypothetical protein
VTTLGTTTTVLRNEVRLVHASTGKPIGPVSARLTPARYGWAVRSVDDTVVVSKRADLADPPVLPKLIVTLLDGRLADLLQFPAVAGLPPRTVRVNLGPATVDVALHPTPMVLEVVLTTATTGAPRTGRTLVARATSGPNPKPVIALPEASPGLYRSAAVEWTQQFVPADLLVNGNQLRTLSIDVSQTTTRVHLVDTT